jgi:hypothetical protein
MMHDVRNHDDLLFPPHYRLGNIMPRILEVVLKNCVIMDG